MCLFPTSTRFLLISKPFKAVFQWFHLQWQLPLIVASNGLHTKGSCFHLGMSVEVAFPRQLSSQSYWLGSRASRVVNEWMGAQVKAWENSSVVSHHNYRPRQRMSTSTQDDLSNEWATICHQVCLSFSADRACRPEASVRFSLHFRTKLRLQSPFITINW